MAASLLLLELVTKSGPLKGNCTIAGFEDHIVVESFSWGITDSDDGVQNKVNRVLKVGKLRLIKLYDMASTGLCKLMEQDTDKLGPHFKTATLKMIDPTSIHGKQKSAYFESIMELTLNDGFIDEISIKVSEKGKTVSITEDITLSVKTSVRFSYYTPDAARSAMPEFVYYLPAPKTAGK